MKQLRLSFVVKALLLLVVFVLLPACGGPSQGSAPKEIVIGASIPESGALAALCPSLKRSYTSPVNHVNNVGCVLLPQYKNKVPIRPVIYDDTRLSPNSMP